MASAAARAVYKGRVATMSGQVIDDGRVFVEGDRIAEVRPASSPAPAGWSGAPTIETQGVIYPGLIDLHGHLAYNALPLWDVPQRYDNRRHWMGSPVYARDIKLPMSALLRQGGAAFARALVRYVEVKLLLGGTTVAQGLTSGTGGSLYRGLVRNAEAPDEAGLRRAGTRVFDLVQNDVQAMRASLDGGGPYIFHLAEGLDAQAAAQFELVEREGLLRANLACIHCLGLSASNHQALRQAGAHTVWSPLSNLLLYGATLDEGAVAAPFALGCDWSPSGSRNLLHEMKVASLHAKALGWKLSAEALARSVTVDAAAALQWGSHCGQVAAGMLADLLVLDARHPDPFENLLRATEREVKSVVIDGQPRYGDLPLMQQMLQAEPLETLTVGGRHKALYLRQAESPLADLNLKLATDYLRESMFDLTRPPPGLALLKADARADDFSVELDMQGDPEAIPVELAALKPRTSIPLDALTVVDDPEHFDRLDRQVNLPAYLKGAAGLRAFYI